MVMKYARVSFVDASTFPAFCVLFPGTYLLFETAKGGGEMREGDAFWNGRRERCRDSPEEVGVQM